VSCVESIDVWGRLRSFEAIGETRAERKRGTCLSEPSGGQYLYQGAARAAPSELRDREASSGPARSGGMNLPKTEVIPCGAHAAMDPKGVASLNLYLVKQMLEVLKLEAEVKVDPMSPSELRLINIIWGATFKIKPRK